MTSPSQARATIVPAVLERHAAELLDVWTQEQTTAGLTRGAAGDLRARSTEFLRLLQQATAETSGVGDLTAVHGAPFARVREFLGALSRQRAAEGATPSETAMFVFSLKRPLFVLLRREAADADRLADELWVATELVDRLGLLTTEAYQRGREEVIARQQQDMLELSTPVVKLWDGILALPMIGTLDSARTQVVMETLLQRIVETGAEVAIIDITGVPTVDTLTAQHLLKTVTAARLMGADCIISGIRPQIAQTIVHLGVDLADVTTKATLADAFRTALARTMQSVAPARHAR
ncbi:STAS domain-containing protein [Roseisolibacter sp. H3M3-2]|uniref:STAS domain-containing protein n=1 Tax=Roseisolibacter sp. H3M3-2 TaxID=3031323 RepID=UPI0023DB7C80|nr:STAS domain-containing protein [Roseisolibacter sp. H3M3-2]MDF1505514.1 STAS domain-containing protein [Roseisolibacter sp. H3M3-2]